MNLLEEAEESAKKKGVKIPNSIKIGLRAIQRMHDISKQYKGDAYELYMETKHPGWTPEWDKKMNTNKKRRNRWIRD